MATVSFEVPDEAMRAIAETPEDFAHALRLAAAMYWYGHADITMGTGAAIAGLDLRGFLTALSQHKQDIFVVDADDIRDDLAALAEYRARNATSA